MVIFLANVFPCLPKCIPLVLAQSHGTPKLLQLRFITICPHDHGCDALQRTQLLLAICEVTVCGTSPLLEKKLLKGWAWEHIGKVRKPFWHIPLFCYKKHPVLLNHSFSKFFPPWSACKHSFLLNRSLRNVAAALRPVLSWSDHAGQVLLFQEKSFWCHQKKMKNKRDGLSFYCCQIFLLRPGLFRKWKTIAAWMGPCRISEMLSS